MIRYGILITTIFLHGEGKDIRKEIKLKDVGELPNFHVL